MTTVTLRDSVGNAVTADCYVALGFEGRVTVIESIIVVASQN